MIRVLRGRSAFSNITSTVILSSVLLAIMITSSYLANDVLSTQMAASEFKTATDLVTTIEREIRKIMFKPGSSTVLKVSFSSTAPGFMRTGETMSVTFTGKTPYSIPVNFLNVEGRQQIGGAFEYDLQGDASLLITPYNGSLGRIHVSKPWNWRVSLDYKRALYTFTGKVNLFDGSDFVSTNTLEVTTIVLDFGEFNVTSNNMIILQNERITTETFELSGDFSLTATAQSGSKTIYLHDIVENPATLTLVNFHRVYIRISVLEGG